MCGKGGMTMSFLYRLLLQLYPWRYRSIFGNEMLSVFSEAQAEFRASHFHRRSRFYLRELLGLIGGAVRERLEDSQGAAKRAVHSGGTMDRRSQCLRFPNFAILMMVLVFVIAIEIIAKGEGLSRYLFHLYAANGSAQSWDLGRSASHWPSH